MMSLRMRKILYVSLTLIACVVWLPLAFAGIAILVGAVGLLSIGALGRGRRARRTQWVGSNPSCFMIEYMLNTLHSS